MTTISASLRRRFLAAAILAAATVPATILSGCGTSNSANNGLTKPQQQIADRTGAIMSASKGNWDAVSPSDKQYLIQTLGNGNEALAKQVFEISMHKPGPPPPPPVVGGSSSPPPSRLPGQ